MSVFKPLRQQTPGGTPYFTRGSIEIFLWISNDRMGLSKIQCLVVCSIRMIYKSSMLRPVRDASAGDSSRFRCYVSVSSAVDFLNRWVVPFPLNMDSTKDPEKTCVLCCQDVEIFALGKCDHPVCYRCSTKMRVLCDQKYCAVCREELDKVRVSLLL